MMITTLDQHVSVLFHAQFRLITTDFFLSHWTERGEEDEAGERKRHKLTKHDREVYLVCISAIFIFLSWKSFQCGLLLDVEYYFPINSSHYFNLSES